MGPIFLLHPIDRQRPHRVCHRPMQVTWSVCAHSWPSNAATFPVPSASRNIVLGRSGRTTPLKSSGRSVPERTKMTSFPNSRWKPSRKLLSICADGVVPGGRLWMTRETGSPPLRGCFAKAASTRRTDSDCSGVGCSLRSKFSTMLAQLRSARSGSVSCTSPRNPVWIVSRSRLHETLHFCGGVTGCAAEW